MTLHTSTPKHCPYQESTSNTLQFLRCRVDKIFKTQGHYGKARQGFFHLEAMGENNTLTAIKGCGVKTIWMTGQTMQG